MIQGADHAFETKGMRALRVEESAISLANVNPRVPFLQIT